MRRDTGQRRQTLLPQHAQERAPLDQMQGITLFAVDRQDSAYALA